jgi:tight adherence protein B
MAGPAQILLPLAVCASAAAGAAALPLALDYLFQLIRRARARTRVISGSEGACQAGLPGHVAQAARAPQAGLPGHVAQAARAPQAAQAPAAALLALPRLLLADILRNGVAPLRHPGRLLLEQPRLHAVFTDITIWLTLRGYQTNCPAATQAILAAALVVAGAVLLLSGIWPVALIAAAAIPFVLHSKAGHFLRQRSQALLDQIPDALRSLGICFGAGYSLQQALEQTAVDTSEPLGAELRQAAADVAAGRSLEESLGLLEQRTNLADLRFAIVALEIQHRTGGSMKELLDRTASSVVATADLKRQLSVQTAQARLSARVVSILPLVLVALLSLAMEGYLATFFSSVAGMTVLLVALALEAAGVLIIRRILGIDLD